MAGGGVTEVRDTGDEVILSEKDEVIRGELGGLGLEDDKS